MKNLPIYTYGMPELRQKTIAVEKFDKALKELAQNMIQTMYVANGIGLAATQVGENCKLVVIDLQTSCTGETVILDGKTIPLQLIQPLVLVNPSFEPIHAITEQAEEGCLSLPKICGTVSRYVKIHVKYQDTDGCQHQLVCEKLMARCVQHELDHLQGILFIDRMTKFERKQNADLLQALKEQKGTIIYEEE